VLGVWWRDLSTVGAASGLVVGAVTAVAALAANLLAGPLPGWPGALLESPGAWCIPLAGGVAVLVSLATPGRVPEVTTRAMVRLHTPESVRLRRSRVAD
jgi:cation/acetate symporter